MFVGVHESGRTTNESLVYFDFAVRSTEFQERAILHCKTDAVKHEPSRLLSDAKSTAHFIGTDSVLAVRNHPNSNKPLVQANRRILEDSPDLDRKLPMMMDGLALPLALILQEHNIITLTSGAGNDAIGPAELDHELQAIVGVGEVDDGLLKSLWFGAHGVPHCQNPSRNALICQVYYCPYMNARKC